MIPDAYRYLTGAHKPASGGDERAAEAAVTDLHIGAVPDYFIHKGTNCYRATGTAEWALSDIRWQDLTPGCKQFR
jgi:hypothetical protein